jgi:hypothetical protein
MSYKVIHYFEDLQDFNHPYRVGDAFPRPGMKVSDRRLAELSSSNNRRKKPLIELVKEVADVQVEKEVEPIVEKQPQYTKTDINRMSTAELKKFAKYQAVSGYKDMTGGELKKVLIDKLGL